MQWVAWYGRLSHTLEASVLQGLISWLTSSGGWHRVVYWWRGPWKRSWVDS
jgi:hypothetical protein